MAGLRTLLRANRGWALGLLALALAMKALVPAGFMPAIGGGPLSVVICDGQGPETAKHIALATPGKAAPQPGAKADGVCPFAGLGSQALGGTDPLLAAVLLLFILATGLVPANVPPVRRAVYLRPPLRGPPACT